MAHRSTTTRSGPRRARHTRQPQKPPGARVSVQVTNLPLPRQATVEPPRRSRLGRRYDARVQARKGATYGPQLHVRPAVVVRLVMVAVAVLVLLALAGWL